LIGDKQRDIDAALSAGVKETYLFDESKKIKKSNATKIVSNLKDIYC
jgi:histidinol phosphatase-like enzyme